MKRKFFWIPVFLMTGILLTACGQKQEVTENEFMDAPVTAPADIMPDAPQEAENETAPVTPETAPPVAE